ncbi:MAG: hypothetical protein LH470_01780 [Lysobacter sp.]|nr:hypothetical protein [Lysobacter sp.]
MLPTPMLLEHRGVIRVFYTGCDDAGRGRPSYVDLDMNDPTHIVAACRRPLLETGIPGTFDDNGAVATSVVRAPDGRLFMYYVGFELGVSTRYRLLTGLAISEDDGESFVRISSAPVLERSDAELFFRCGPHVLSEDGVFRMWYVAGSRWVDIDGKQMPEYRIVNAESADGIRWPTSGRVAIDITQPDEHGFGRPWVLRDRGRHVMYYSVRRKSFRAYRMGYAESDDGIHWKREDARLNLDTGPGDYDDDAIMYAAPIEIAGRLWCFYNGNDFGREGIALAVRESA